MKLCFDETFFSLFFKLIWDKKKCVKKVIFSLFNSGITHSGRSPLSTMAWMDSGEAFTKGHTSSVWGRERKQVTIKLDGSIEGCGSGDGAEGCKAAGQWMEKRKLEKKSSRLIEAYNEPLEDKKWERTRLVCGVHCESWLCRISWIRDWFFFSLKIIQWN